MNRKTKETTWEAPEELAWRRVQHEYEEEEEEEEEENKVEIDDARSSSISEGDNGTKKKGWFS